MFTGEHTSLALAARQVRATSGEVLQNVLTGEDSPNHRHLARCSQPEPGQR
jgi:hypothetical protein